MSDSASFSRASSMGEGEIYPRSPSPERRALHGGELPYKTDMYISRRLLKVEHLLGTYLPPDQVRQSGVRLRDVGAVVPLQHSGGYAELQFGNFPTLRSSDRIVRKKLGAYPSEHMVIRHDASPESYKLAADMARAITVPTKYGQSPTPTKVAVVTNYPRGITRVFDASTELPDSFAEQPPVSRATPRPLRGISLSSPDLTAMRITGRKRAASAEILTPMDDSRADNYESPAGTYLNLSPTRLSLPLPADAEKPRVRRQLFS